MTSAEPRHQTPHIRHPPQSSLRVSMPLAVRADTTSRRLVAPPARMSATTCAKSAACWSALPTTAVLRHTALPSPPQGLGTIGVAQLHPARLCQCQRLLGASGDGLPLYQWHRRYDADRHVIGSVYVSCEKARAIREGSGSPCRFRLRLLWSKAALLQLANDPVSHMDAALAVEREDCVKAAPHTFFQRYTKPAAGAVESGAHRH